MTAAEMIRSTVLVVLIVAGAYTALHDPPGLLSWPMYTRIGFYRFELYTNPDMSAESRIRQDDLTGVFDPFSTDRQIDLYLEFLSEVHGIRPVGAVVGVGRSGQIIRDVGRDAVVDV